MESTAKNLVRKFREKFPNLSHSQLAREILKADKTYSFETLRKYSYKLKISGTDNNVINTHIEKDIKYEVYNDCYNWNTHKGDKISISVEQADLLFYEYSEHGLNLTQTQIINKHGFKVWEWYSIKNVLGIYKKSNIFSPYTVEHTSKEDLEYILTTKIEYALNDKLNIENIYQKTVVKNARKLIQENNKNQFYSQSFLTSLFDELPKIDFSSFKVNSTNLKTDTPNLNIFIADLHAGARVEGLHITPNYNLQILEDKLNNIATKINSLQSNCVTINLVGDLIESFTGLNHLNSWQSMEQGFFGATAVKKTVEILLSFFTKIHNLKQINGVGGNHDRGDNSNKVDDKGEIAGIIFYILEKVLPIPVYFNFDCVSTTVDNIQYVMMHGHHRESTESSEKIILNYGKQGIYNLIVTGHLHTLKIKSDTHNFRHIVCPSIFSGNNYSERNGWTSNSSFMIAYNNGTNRPEVMLIPV